jgi:hypothetical protein
MYLQTSRHFLNDVQRTVGGKKIAFKSHAIICYYQITH